MPKQRGFRPQGLIAPIQRIKYNGPTILDKINRETRPTWDDLKDRIKNQEGNKMLEEYENERYLEELSKNRTEKIKEQERRYIKKLKKEYKKKHKRKNDDKANISEDSSKKRKKRKKYRHYNSSDTSSSDSSSSNVKKKKIKKNSLSSCSSASDKKRYKKKKKNENINPFKLSSFFKMK